MSRGKKVALFGLTFKPNTDDMRDAPSIAIVQTLIDAGAEVYAHDPEGMEEAAKILPEVKMTDSAYAASERCGSGRHRHRMGCLSRVGPDQVESDNAWRRLARPAQYLQRSRGRKGGIPLFQHRTLISANREHARQNDPHQFGMTARAGFGVDFL
jgi:hypothetical protein